MFPVSANYLSKGIREYPRSPLHLILASRVLRGCLEGDLADEVLTFAGTVQTEWPELNLLVSFEKAMAAMIRLDWKEAAERFAVLKAATYWSPAFFSFSEACAQCMVGKVSEAQALCLETPSLVTRKFGGRVISVEQYILSKCELYGKRPGRSMFLPGLGTVVFTNCGTFRKEGKCKAKGLSWQV
jgi:hypothetical protein